MRHLAAELSPGGVCGYLLQGYRSLGTFRKKALPVPQRDAFHCMGKTITFGALDKMTSTSPLGLQIRASAGGRRSRDP